MTVELSMDDLREVTEQAAQEEAAQDLAHTLRKIADLVSMQEQYLPVWAYIFRELRYYAISEMELKAALSAFLPHSRKTMGGERGVNKEWNGEYLSITGWVGQIPFTISSYRGLVCERVVTGVREVEVEVPDPNAPKILTIQTVEDFEWKCSPLLAGLDES